MMAGTGVLGRPFIDKIFTDIKINKKKKMAAQQQNKALPTEQNTTPATQ